MTGGVLHDYNRETLDLWLGAYAGGYAGIHREKIGSQPNRKKATLTPVNWLWLEANKDPKVSETNEMLTKIVIERMPYEKTLTWPIFWYLYIREHDNPSEAERWRNSDNPYDQLRYTMLVKGKKWILSQVYKMRRDYVLTVPDPINPEGFLQKAKSSQRTATRVYYENVGEHGDKKARQIAADASGYSERHIRRLIPKEDPNVE